MSRAEVLATRALWAVVVLIHIICTVYYAFMALVYYSLPSTLAGDHMRAFGLVISFDRMPVIEGYFALCAVIHVVLLFEMVITSVHRRSLAFYSKVGMKTVKKGARWLHQRFSKAAHTQVGASSQESPRPRLATILGPRSTGRFDSNWERWFGFAGYFGVGGKHFVMLFLAREVLEATLQSIQAYQLSKFVPRQWLNELAVAIVAVSCWSTPAIQRLMSRSPRVELLLCLLVDLVLDIVSSVGVPVALGAMYLGDYDWTLTNFAYTKYSNQVWFANLNSEFKQLFIQNWFDFGTRALFAIATLLSLNDVKLLVTATAPSPDCPNGSSSRCVFRGRASVTVRQQRFETLLHAGLILWGAFILGLHAQSALKSGADPSECLAAVRPWLVSAASCASLRIDCQAHEGMTGKAAELETRWARLDPHALSMLTLANCPALYIPASIQAFSGLKALYFRSSTVMEWSSDAALTGRHHFELRQLSFSAANLTPACDPSSSLPPGLLSNDFPQTLGTLYSFLVPLDKLPLNLHKIWPRRLSLLLLPGSFSTIPDVLPRLDPVRVVLWGNGLRHVPAELFEGPSIRWVDLAWNPLDDLPALVSPSAALTEISLLDTNISRLPVWTEDDSFRSRVVVKAARTPFCTQLAAAPDAESHSLATRYC